MSQIGKKGGVSIFQKCLKFKNVPKVGWGGGVNPNWDIVPNFSILYFDASPYNVSLVETFEVNCKDGIIYPSGKIETFYRNSQITN